MRHLVKWDQLLGITLQDLAQGVTFQRMNQDPAVRLKLRAAMDSVVSAPVAVMLVKLTEKYGQQKAAMFNAMPSEMD